MSRTDQEKVEKMFPAKTAGPLITRENVAKILQAERRAVVRMVKKLGKKESALRLQHMVRTDGYMQACTDILKALAARGRK